MVQDIEVVLSDGDRTDGVDPLELIEAIVAAEAIPPDGVSGTDGAKFLDAQAGTQLFWQVTLRNGAVAPGAGPQRIRVRAVFLGRQWQQAERGGREGTGWRVDRQGAGRNRI